MEWTWKLLAFLIVWVGFTAASSVGFSKTVEIAARGTNATLDVPTMMSVPRAFLEIILGVIVWVVIVVGCGWCCKKAFNELGYCRGCSLGSHEGSCSVACWKTRVCTCIYGPPTDNGAETVPDGDPVVRTRYPRDTNGNIYTSPEGMPLDILHGGEHQATVMDLPPSYDEAISSSSNAPVQRVATLPMYNEVVSDFATGDRCPSPTLASGVATRIDVDTRNPRASSSQGSSPDLNTPVDVDLEHEDNIEVKGDRQHIPPPYCVVPDSPDTTHIEMLNLEDCNTVPDRSQINNTDARNSDNSGNFETYDAVPNSPGISCTEPTTANPIEQLGSTDSNEVNHLGVDTPEGEIHIEGSRSCDTIDIESDAVIDIQDDNCDYQSLDNPRYANEDQLAIFETPQIDSTDRRSSPDHTSLDLQYLFENLRPEDVTESIDRGNRPEDISTIMGRTDPSFPPSCSSSDETIETGTGS